MFWAIELFRKNFDLKKNSIQKNNYNAERLEMLYVIFQFK